MKQQPPYSLDAQKVWVQSPGAVEVHPHCCLLFGLGQQAGMQLLYFPLNSPSASSSAFRLEAVKTDTCSGLSPWLPACPCSQLL